MSHKGNVYVIDDNPAMRASLDFLLGTANFNVTLFDTATDLGLVNHSRNKQGCPSVSSRDEEIAAGRFGNLDCDWRAIVAADKTRHGTRQSQAHKARPDLSFVRVQRQKARIYHPKRRLSSKSSIETRSASATRLARAFSDRNESVGIPKTARVRFKLDAGEGGQHA
ncbi:MAG TPA: hypothetical protein VFS91_05480 [Nitrobacter sp.]|jgi:hypothetical protein|nr:hypothetical protein [Nitrobacter sp.]